MPDVPVVVDSSAVATVDFGTGATHALRAGRNHFRLPPGSYRAVVDKAAELDFVVRAGQPVVMHYKAPSTRADNYGFRGTVAFGSGLPDAAPKKRSAWVLFTVALGVPILFVAGLVVALALVFTAY